MITSEDFLRKRLFKFFSRENEAKSMNALDISYFVSVSINVLPFKRLC